MRSVLEWIGMTDDTPIPPRVRLRVFDRYGGICYLTGRKITASDTWDVDHIIALANGGEHRENNLAPALKEPHKEKTRADRREKKIVDRKRKKFLGITKSKHPMMGSKASGWKRGFDGVWKRRAD